jgi:YD repeat-containing protein
MRLPDGTTLDFGYDPAGNLRTVESGGNLVEEYEYDAANRLSGYLRFGDDALAVYQLRRP